MEILKVILGIYLLSGFLPFSLRILTAVKDLFLLESRSFLLNVYRGGISYDFEERSWNSIRKETHFSAFLDGVSSIVINYIFLGFIFGPIQIFGLYFDLRVFRAKEKLVDNIPFLELKERLSIADLSNEMANGLSALFIENINFYSLKFLCRLNNDSVFEWIITDQSRKFKINLLESKYIMEEDLGFTEYIQEFDYKFSKNEVELRIVNYKNIDLSSGVRKEMNLILGRKIDIGAIHQKYDENPYNVAGNLISRCERLLKIEKLGTWQDSDIALRYLCMKDQKSNFDEMIVKRIEEIESAVQEIKNVWFQFAIPFEEHDLGYFRSENEEIQNVYELKAHFQGSSPTDIREMSDKFQAIFNAYNLTHEEIERYKTEIYKLKRWIYANPMKSLEEILITERNRESISGLILKLFRRLLFR